MPRPGPRRVLFALKLTEESIAYIASRAREEGLLKGNGEPNSSEMARRMLAYASAKMPKGWTP